jgi:hypothetical protein
MPTRTLNISLDEDLWEEANILAVRKRVSFTELIRRSLRSYCDGEHVDSITIDERGKIDPPEGAPILRSVIAARRV